MTHQLGLLCQGWLRITMTHELKVIDMWRVSTKVGSQDIILEPKFERTKALMSQGYYNGLWRVSTKLGSQKCAKNYADPIF